MANSIKLVTPVAIMSFPTLYVARAFAEGQEPKYSAMLGFTPEADMKALKQAVGAVAKEKWGDRAKQILKNNNPFRDHDAEVEAGQTKDKGFPAGTVFFNARSKNPPAVVARTAGPDGRPVVIDEAVASTAGPYEIYGGVMVKAYVSVYAYDTAGNRGIGFGLEGVQRWEDGERLDGRAAVASVFDFEEAAEVDLDEDVMGDDEEDEGEDGSDDPLDYL
jgi:hypothetical protein